MAIAGATVPAIERSIFLVRGHRAMLDSDLARLYGTQTKVLVQAVKRNLDRFPSDFMFHLTNQEVIALRSQIVTSKKRNPGRGGRRYPVYAFTEQGVAMLSTVLRSPRAISINIEIMRAFVRLRWLIAQNQDFAKQLSDLESKLTTHDRAIVEILEAIRRIMAPPAPQASHKIGFV